METNESHYNLSLEDIGAKITVVVTNQDNPHQIELETIGPIQLDPSMKLDLEGMVIGEKGVFKV